MKNYTLCRIPFEKSFASNIEKSEYWSIKNELNPRDVFKSSNKKYIFDCKVCHHEFNIRLSYANKGRWCSFCTNQKLCNNLDCNLCFNKSFASHKKSEYWSIKNELNPRDVFKKSDKKYTFDCKVCHHEFNIRLSDANKGRWCSFCSSPPKQLCDNLDCNLCFNKSFASHKKSEYWSKQNKLNQRDVFKSSNKKYIFDCRFCNHEFNIALNSVTAGKWCSFCANRKLCNNLDCNLCFNKSFACHEKSEYWSKQNELNPRDVFKSSNKKYTFDCKVCNHEFNIRLSDANNGKWCPKCVNKTETKLYNALLTLFPNIIFQFKQEWSKNKKYLPFDFCILEYNIIIELDGPQHFKNIDCWNSNSEEQNKRDKYKEECANSNNFSIIRIIQEDVLFDKYDWFSLLIKSIEEIKISKETQNHYLCQNNEYHKFMDESDILT